MRNIHLQRLAVTTFIVAVLAIAKLALAAAPTVRAMGNVASGTGTIAPSIPSGTAEGDLLVMQCETRDNETTSCSSNCDAGWTQIASETGLSGAAGTGSRNTIFYQVADATPIAPTMADAGNHTACKMLAITTGTYATTGGLPYSSLVQEQRNTAASAVSQDGGTTTGTDCLVMWAISGELDNSSLVTACYDRANASLTSVSSRWSHLQNNGDGGILCMSDGRALGTTQAMGTWSLNIEFPENTAQNAVGGEIMFAVCNSYPAVTRRIFNVD